MPILKPDDVHVQPGDVPDLINQLRKLAADFDSHAFLVSGSFVHFGGEVETAAAAARPAVQTAANKLYSLLEALEKTGEYRRKG